MAGRFILYVAVGVILIMALFWGAAILFTLDPTGYQTRGWLTTNRHWLFIWRLMLYSLLACLWFSMMRSKILEKAPNESLYRLEWMSITLILVVELAVWRPVLV
ncbi:hypothetical protein [Yersinia aldovae]|uniref:Uncharacterized protein n=2 Tax=Yersinia aldovae TaxID=29483 RepID=A0ABM9SZE3_YERAL|nr:hypothetical protein [Yersinia aldovae]CNL84420.1 Uncharacterised protein [Yersinia aldovae]